MDGHGHGTHVADRLPQQPTMKINRRFAWHTKMAGLKFLSDNGREASGAIDAVAILQLWI